MLSTARRDVDLVSRSTLQQISGFGDRYVKEYLGKYDGDELKKDWWAALNFFFDHSFYQGRRDDVSTMIRDVAFDALKDVLGSEPDEMLRVLTRLDSDGIITRQTRTNPIWASLLKNRKVIAGGKMREHHVGKRADRIMVITTLALVAKLGDHNIVNYSLGQMTAGPGEFYQTLTGPNKPIFSVGDKIASFWMRDLVSLYNLESSIAEEDLLTIEPIDTWVRQLTVKIGIAEKGDPDEVIRQRIIEACKANGISPFRYNQGAWYLSYNTRDILLEPH